MLKRVIESGAFAILLGLLIFVAQEEKKRGLLLTLVGQKAWLGWVK